MFSNLWNLKLYNQNYHDDKKILLFICQKIISIEKSLHDQIENTSKNTYRIWNNLVEKYFS